MFYDTRIDYIHSWFDFVYRFKTPLQLSDNVILISINEIQIGDEYFYSYDEFDIIRTLLNTKELWTEL